MCVCVCVSVCLSVRLSVTMLAAIYLVCMFEMKRDRVPCRLLKICIEWTSLILNIYVREIWHNLPAAMIGDS